MATITRVYRRDTSAALARRRSRSDKERELINAELERMAQDSDYREQQRQLEDELDGAANEALKIADNS